MSAGSVHQEALRWLRRLQLPEVAERDVLATMEATRGGPLPLMYEAGAEAGLGRDELLRRCTALFLALAVGNLADDLADGDCSYITPLVAAPGTQYLLSAWCFAALAECIPPSLLARTAAELVQSAALQNVEVRTESWTIDAYRSVGEGIAARQWAAYLAVLWHDTPLAPRANELGWHLGISGHVAQDLSSQSRRLRGLGSDGLREIVAWADASLAVLVAAKLRFLDAAVAWMTARIHPPSEG